MRSYINLLVANFKMTVRNRQSLFWLFVFPVLMMSLLGLVFGGAGQQQAKIAIVQNDGGLTASSISKSFSKISAFAVTKESKAMAMKDLKNGNVDGVLVMEKGFASGIERYPAGMSSSLGNTGRRGTQQAGGVQPRTPNIVANPASPPNFNAARPGAIQAANVELYYDPSSTFTSQAVRSAVTNILGEINRRMSGAPTFLSYQSHSVRSKGLRYIDFLVPGIIAMTLMNSALFGLSGTVVNYRERGILRRLKVTPQPLTGFIAAQISNQLVFAIIRAGLLILVGHYFFQVAVVGDYLSLLAVVIIGSLCFTTLAFSVASFSATRETADTLSNIISMPMMFLGGVFFPVDSAPKWIQPLIKVLPLRYLGSAMRDVMVKGSSLWNVRGDLYVLLGVTAFFFAVSVKLWKWE